MGFAANVIWLACLCTLMVASTGGGPVCEGEGDLQMLMQRRGMHKAIHDQQGDSMSDVTAPESNPPKWSGSVYVFDPKMENISCTLNSLFSQLGPIETGKFSSLRVALLFKPGKYDLDVPVGYYTQVLGLGKSPEDVAFTGNRGIYGPSQPGNVNFDTFWKGVENLANHPKLLRTTWSVSQAAPMRRVKVYGDLAFGEPGPDGPSKGSGGFAANVKVTGSVDLVRQQQWLLRNCEVQNSTYFNNPPRAVNFVYVGTTGAPKQTARCTNSLEDPETPHPQLLVVEEAPQVVEKPYITISPTGKYSLEIPQVSWRRRGTAWDNAETVDFEQVFVATTQTDPQLINQKLATGRHVVLSPGIYSLSSPLQIGFNKSITTQVLLGLGMATLVATNGTAAVEVGPFSAGVRVVGLLLQAGTLHSPALLHWAPNSFHPRNPGLLADIFVRVGGPDSEVVSADIMVKVAGNHVILDNVWAWRADCCQRGCGTCAPRYCNNGVVVDGRYVVSYGLFSEHTQKDLTVWNGEGGMSFFYQSEMDSFAREPWDHTPDYGENGVCGYRINAHNHTGVGIGVYVYFTQPGNLVKSGIVRTRDMGTTLICPFAWNLNPAWYKNSKSGIQSAVGFPTEPVRLF